MHVLAQGTGQALDTARRGDADLVLVHDPEAEQKFIDEGHGVNRRQIAWNDFIVVGPDADPAKIRGGHDAVAAFKAVAAAKAPFVSRGDRSGTNALELRLWKAAEIDPKSGAGSWYRDIGGGMGQALNAAVGDAGLYPVRPRHLAQLQEQGAARGRRRGRSASDQPLRRDRTEPEDAFRRQARRGARLADWLAGPEGQAAIGAFRSTANSSFTPPPPRRADRRRDGCTRGRRAAYLESQP